METHFYPRRLSVPIVRPYSKQYSLQVVCERSRVSLVYYLLSFLFFLMNSSYFWDVAEAIKAAQTEIFITDWWLYPKVYPIGSVQTRWSEFSDSVYISEARSTRQEKSVRPSFVRKSKCWGESVRSDLGRVQPGCQPQQSLGQACTRKTPQVLRPPIPLPLFIRLLLLRLH